MNFGKGILSYLLGKLRQHQASGLLSLGILVLAFPKLGLQDLLLARVLSQDFLASRDSLGRERHFLGWVSSLEDNIRRSRFTLKNDRLGRETGLLRGRGLRLGLIDELLRSSSLLLMFHLYNCN